jgi:DNA-binding NarL/FixJ family response regulator
VESFVSVATVRSQVRAILLKLGVNSQLAAVAAARQSGWFDASSSSSSA